jgi:hypothetical protein
MEHVLMKFEEVKKRIHDLNPDLTPEGHGKDVWVYYDDGEGGLPLMEKLAATLGTDKIDYGSGGCSSCGYGAYVAVLGILDDE